MDALVCSHENGNFQTFYPNKQKRKKITKMGFSVTQIYCTYIGN